MGFAEAAAWIERATRDAGFATLCVSPFLVPLAAQRLAGTSHARVLGRAGSRSATRATESKAEEAAHLVALGCVEVDMVLNIAALLEGDDDFVRDDIAAVVDGAPSVGTGAALVKVILETGYLSDEHISRGCRARREAGARRS